jgi:hypothetical protein
MSLFFIFLIFGKNVLQISDKSICFITSFQLLAIINKAAMNIVEHVSFLPVGDICPGEVLLDPPVEIGFNPIGMTQ